MSRIGKKPVVVPSGVTAKVDGQLVQVKGAKGQLEFIAPDDVTIALQDNQIKVDPRDNSKRARAMWEQPARALITSWSVSRRVLRKSSKSPALVIVQLFKVKLCSSPWAIRMM